MGHCWRDRSYLSNRSDKLVDGPRSGNDGKNQKMLESGSADPTFARTFILVFDQQRVDRMFVVMRMERRGKKDVTPHELKQLPKTLFG